MPYTLGQAAKATGLSKPTISEAIKNGKISARKNESGAFEIDPAELHRVYPPLSTPNGRSERQPLQNLTPEPNTEAARLEAVIDGLRAVLRQVEDERDDLRRRLDKESDERARLTLLLTHQPETPLNENPAPPPAVRPAFLWGLGAATGAATLAALFRYWSGGW